MPGEAGEVALATFLPLLTQLDLEAPFPADRGSLCGVAFRQDDRVWLHVLLLLREADVLKAWGQVSLIASPSGDLEVCALEVHHPPQLTSEEEERCHVYRIDTIGKAGQVALSAEVERTFDPRVGHAFFGQFVHAAVISSRPVKALHATRSALRLPKRSVMEFEALSDHLDAPQNPQVIGTLRLVHGGDEPRAYVEATGSLRVPPLHVIGPTPQPDQAPAARRPALTNSAFAPARATSAAPPPTPQLRVEEQDDDTDIDPSAWRSAPKLPKWLLGLGVLGLFAWGGMSLMGEEPTPPPKPEVAADGASALKDTRYTWASSLNLRESPNSNSDLVDRLVINTVVTPSETRGAFTRVELESGREGWVATRFLATAPLTVAHALDLSKRAETSDEALEWMQRAAALAPERRDVLIKLALAYEAVGDSEAASQTRRTLRALPP